MKRTLIAPLILIFLSVGFRMGGSNPKAVEIRLANGGKLVGEILAVRDSSIVVITPAGIADEEITKWRDNIVVLPHRDILFIQTPEGSSNWLLGMAIGSAAGCLIGYGIGHGQSVSEPVSGCEESKEEQRDQNAAAGATVGLAAGALVGTVIGAVSRSGGEVLISPGQRNFNRLSGVARYVGYEPPFLKSIGAW